MAIMKAPSSIFLPCGMFFRTAVSRSLLQPASVPRFAKSYSALVSGALRNQLRNRTPTLYPASPQRCYSASQITRPQRQIPSEELKTNPSQQVTENIPTSNTQEPLKSDTPAYEITFTCKPCQTRSTHKISKQGYHKGTILITCPDCKNRHLICDHLQIFRDKSTTIEDILKEKGEHVKQGTLGTEGDIEIWDDGTTTERATI